MACTLADMMPPAVPRPAPTGAPPLFSPITLRSVTIPNRIVISPMQQYAADAAGGPSAWHHEHLGRLARGGAGLVFTEVIAVEPRGRNTHRDQILCRDDQIPALAKLADTIRSRGSIAGIQIGHSGRKASTQCPWDGWGPLTESDALRGEPPWQTVAPSALAANPGWPVPQALARDEIGRLLDAFAAAARRGAAAGFDCLNIHGAHGYLIHTFLSPLSNLREDAYGGDRAGRMRFALEVAEAVRSTWPADRPIFYRISAVDDLPGGWQIEDSIALATALGERGIDVIDCSSSGLKERTTTAPIPRREGYQVPYAEAIRRGAGIATMAVGLIRSPRFANAVVAEGRADIVAIGREALFNPFWPRHAAAELAGEDSYRDWPQPYGWWLEKRARTARLAAAAAPFPAVEAPRGDEARREA